ncbi:MAG TPA: DegT/DnrJ/EryC1/StrS family aminotransferase [Acidimicrobiia bacterium]|nr:DegT/DnrJ/EryC1/StrS family aminotransferase [Acidimicrobiia bacterium]
MAALLRIPSARLGFTAEERADILGMIDAALRDGALTLGSRTEEFERAFAARHDADDAVAVSSGSAALEIALRIFGVEDRDVVVPTNTFFATAAAVVRAGGRPRFADVDAATFALSAETVAEALTPATAGVVLVHIGGVVAPAVGAIRELCDDRGLFLLEDAAHAHGSRLDGRSAGTFGHAAAFSFYPTKVLTSAEGGMLLVDDPAARDLARVYRDQGKVAFVGGEHTVLGSAWRMSELHAAVGLVHLRGLDRAIAVRTSAAHVYDDALASVEGIEPLAVAPASRPNYYKYPALLDPGIDRHALKQALRSEHGVALSGEVYARPLHREPVFRELAEGTFPVAEDVCARQVCLPVFSDMSEAEARIVVDALRSELGAGGRAPAPGVSVAAASSFGAESGACASR